MRRFMLALAVFLTPLLLSAPAYASDTDFGGSRGNGRYSIGRVTAVIDDLVDVMEQVWAIMVSNPFLVVLVAASLIALGVRIFRKVKRAAKG